MTHDERISSYIDNELTMEQEQEFLISLAASEGLRKSFRSELVLKNVLHHDEAVTNPPRALRTAVFTTLGIGAAATLAGKANAATSQASGMAGRTLLRSLFATKMGALITAAGISISALAGYGVHSLVAPQPSAPIVATHTLVPAAAPSVMPSHTQPVAISNQSDVATATVRQEAAAMPSQHGSRNHAAHRLAHTTQAAKPAAQGVNGSGSVIMEPPTINGK